MPAPRWMSQAASEEFSWSQTLGGTRGVIETSAPGLIFVIVYVATHALVPTLVAASAVAVIACIIRLIQRQSTQQAVSGLFRVADGVLLAAAPPKNPETARCCLLDKSPSPRDRG